MEKPDDGLISQFWFDSGKLRYSHRFADLANRAPRICLFFSFSSPTPPILSPPSSNLIPIGYALNAGKWRVWRKFRGKPPFLCHHLPTCLPDACLKEINSDKKEKPTPAQF